jgi:hypothetical protein
MSSSASLWMSPSLGIANAITVTPQKDPIMQKAWNIEIFSPRTQAASIAVKKGEVA